ncbi:glycosyltransferase [Gordonia phthalatica]|uniref:Glycosyl transferase n=1 Tax=Gordonia phthalatica TaxID=1136941 RepID=A0A0N9NJP1_9ACTN|nr:glycosyltransferase [Gordonia phthalatica]ALG85851.1 hypothetical protein ACH46_16865 [Gordonia phthalatica]
MRTTFILGKDPSSESTGDMTLASLIMQIAREEHEVDAICLSSTPSSERDGHTRVAKPEPEPLPLLVRSVLSHRSLLHTRFDIDALARAVDDHDTDQFVADHSYMAECVLRSKRYDPSVHLTVSTTVSEVEIWKQTRGLPGRIDAPRIRRDELRVARRARSVGCYESAETDDYRANGVPATWLDLTLPPKARVDPSDTPPRLLFLGDRRWAPNADAAELLIEWWPAIADGIAGAELVLVGAPDPDRPLPPLPDGVRDLGFVDDLGTALATCRALAAPIRTGGGVRVKILDVAARGLPVVGTRAAVGSLDSVLGLGVYDDRDAFVNQCRQLLTSPALAHRLGDSLYGANADRWRLRLPHRSVHEWLE